MPPTIMGCTTTGAPIRSVAARTASALDKSRAMPPVSVLCTRLGGLHDDGVAERFGSRHGFPRGRRDTIRDQRNPVCHQQLVQIGRIQPAVVRLRERALDDDERSLSVDVVERRRGAEWPPQPVGPLGGATERPGGGLRKREGSGGSLS